MILLKYLLHKYGKRGWSVQDTPTATGSSIHSPSGSLCPANPRAQYNEVYGEKNWEYFNNGWKEFSKILIKCNKH